MLEVLLRILHFWELNSTWRASERRGWNEWRKWLHCIQVELNSITCRIKSNSFPLYVWTSPFDWSHFRKSFIKFDILAQFPSTAGQRVERNGRQVVRIENDIMAISMPWRHYNMYLFQSEQHSKNNPKHIYKTNYQILNNIPTLHTIKSFESLDGNSFES